MISTNRSDNLDLVNSAFDAWNRGDIEAFADHVVREVGRALEIAGVGAPRNAT